MCDGIRIGMIGTGRIASRFFDELQEVEGIVVSGIFNRRIESARRFAESRIVQEIPKESVSGIRHWSGFCTDDLKELLDVSDAVYIATPHETHAAYVREALLAGKHVLCEKPMTLSGEEAKELFSLARSKNLVLMEAVKTAYCPGFQEVIRIAGSGMIGEVCEVEAGFTRLTQPGVREMEDLRFGGSFTEFGTYCMLPIVKLLGTETEEIQFWQRPLENGLDGYTQAFFRYDGRWGVAKTGLSVKSEGQLLVSGTKGYILVPSPWWLTKNFSVCFEDVSKRQDYSFPFEKAGLRYEIASFVENVQEVLECSEKRDRQERMEASEYSEKRDRQERMEASEYSEKRDRQERMEASEYSVNREVQERMEVSAVRKDQGVKELSGIFGLTAEESIWMAERMQMFLESRR